MNHFSHKNHGWYYEPKRRTRPMFKITYSNHDQKANGGFMIREGIERAKWTADLMRQCGYQTVTIEPIKE